jgi:hypothetical protein
MLDNNRLPNQNWVKWKQDTTSEEIVKKRATPEGPLTRKVKILPIVLVNKKMWPTLVETLYA